MPSGGSISFKVDAKSVNGQTIKTRNITFYNFGSFMVFPNPSKGNFQIDLNPELEFKIEIIGLGHTIQRQHLSIKGDDMVDFSQLENGEYWLKIYYEEKLIHEQRIILKK
ncbi:hypothetical protein SAMN00777080_1950 [Aquiflexum balticum DSM 16537]|uniref:Secretion system C-terminal sorting domain-containing protein n=1 Tax=Aquiflexum balticum DSM 16537 TaxID=758820 RepID=A0A1W2H409_9BACT|nr:T9SS type A sorting domain-containing protein [Aquiflexum balticum]SMD43358.1 hypothetical protein SAMN00777080_1950 [Aquiflexum balticum DSM 16537]